jgi:hypothetical protein
MRIFIFRIFTGLSLDYFRLNSARSKHLSKSFPNCNVKIEKKMYKENKQEPVEQGNAHRLGFGHRKVYISYF